MFGAQPISNESSYTCATLRVSFSKEKTVVHTCRAAKEACVSLRTKTTHLLHHGLLICSNTTNMTCEIRMSRCRNRARHCISNFHQQSSVTVNSLACMIGFISCVSLVHVWRPKRQENSSRASPKSRFKINPVNVSWQFCAPLATTDTVGSDPSLANFSFSLVILAA